MKSSVDKRAKSSKLNRVSHNHHWIIPPTCTTFNNFGTTRNGLGNVAGFADEKYISTGHKKPFATFGLPKGHLTKGNHKDLCMTMHPQFPKNWLITK